MEEGYEMIARQVWRSLSGPDAACRRRGLAVHVLQSDACLPCGACRFPHPGMRARDACKAASTCLAPLCPPACPAPLALPAHLKILPSHRFKPSLACFRLNAFLEDKEDAPALPMFTSCCPGWVGEWPGAWVPRQHRWVGVGLAGWVPCQHRMHGLAIQARQAAPAG